MFRLQPTATVRAAVFLAGDLLLWTGALWAAFLIRFEGAVPPQYAARIPALLLVLIPVKLVWSRIYRLYQLTWRLVGLREFIAIVKANTLALLTLATAALLLRFAEALATLPRSVLLLDYVLTTCGVTVFRAARRGWQVERERLRSGRQRPGTRLLIVGAGAAGARIAQAVQDSDEHEYQPVGFVDDDPAKRATYIHGLRVLGGRADLSRFVREHAVDEVLVAIPSAPPDRLRAIIHDAREAGVQQIKVLPGLHEYLSGRATLKDIREIDLHDLLPRPAVRIQFDALTTYLDGKRILVTGAAGSIGSELVRQLSRFPVAQIVAVDVNETGLFELEQALLDQVPGIPLRTAIGDIRDPSKMEWLTASVRPHLVFHAAAYKHVPMMEREVDEAVKTNIFGTLTVGEAAARHGVETCVFISTDKAVNSASVLGATKRVGELIMQLLGRRHRTRFLAVRFGNVLGSRGSLVPIIQEQIRRGGPVTITHPDMTRYFMTVAEAVLLVLQTPLLTSPGPVFMLDMGEPVRILDLARELIRLAGLEADTDIPIVFSGIRAGEKLEEELTMPDEEVSPTIFDRVMEVRSATAISEVSLRLVLRELEQLVRVIDADGIRMLLEHLVRAPASVVPLDGPAVHLPAPVGSPPP